MKELFYIIYIYETYILYVEGTMKEIPIKSHKNHKNIKKKKEQKTEKQKFKFIGIFLRCKRSQ